MLDVIADRFNYIVVIALMMIGLYGVVSSANLVKRLVGLSIFQTSVFLLYITMGKVFGGVPPILPYPADHGEGHGDSHAAGQSATAATGHHDDGHSADHGEADADHSADHAGEGAHHGEAAMDHAASEHADLGPAYDGIHHASEVLYSNPLPHVLILTAIVVGVATLAVGLALVVRIRESYGTIEDSAIARADYSDEIERGTA